jgi:hypothetical protein
MKKEYPCFRTKIYRKVHIIMVSKLTLLPPMSRSKIKGLPEELREIMLTYSKPIDKAISVLLRSRGNEDFERKSKDITLELLKYFETLALALTEERFNLLFRKYLEISSQAGFVPQVQTPLTQALSDAMGVIANFIRLVLEPDYKDHVSNHLDVLEPYTELLTYTAILLYINDKPETKIKQPMIKKIIKRCQNAASNVEDYIDTIEIDADHEASAALERAKQIPF